VIWSSQHIKPMNITTSIKLVAVTLLLVGCVTHQPVEIKDGGPGRDLDVSHIADPVPRWEARTRAGNSNPYTVLGKTYHLVSDTAGFRQTGYASWYGTKFHGRHTANGEIYDMYGMTAAHKTLPIPSYVRVTNKNNGKSVIVRVNDRGPFHDGRIIDLSYTAAKKLGFVEQGTAPVELEYIDVSESQPAQANASGARVAGSALSNNSAPAPANSAGYALPPNTFLQVGAFGSEAAAKALQARLTRITDYPVLVTQADNARLLRVRVGPFKDNLDLMNLRQKLIDGDFSEPHVVYDESL
jgi:rare lipoprotein A